MYVCIYMFVDVESILADDEIKCVHVCMHTCMYVYTHVRMYIHMYVYMYVHMYVCIYMSVDVESMNADDEVKTISEEESNKILERPTTSAQRKYCTG